MGVHPGDATALQPLHAPTSGKDRWQSQAHRRHSLPASSSSLQQEYSGAIARAPNPAGTQARPLEVLPPALPETAVLPHYCAHYGLVGAGLT